MKTFGKDFGRFLAAALVLLLCAAEWGSACEIIRIRVQMPRSFDVEVTDAEGPVSGLLVEVYGADSTGLPERRLFEGVTNEQGLVEMRNLDPGEYSIVVGEGTAFKGQSFVEIPKKSVRRLPRKLRMQWIEDTVVRVHAFAGSLRSYDLGPRSEGKSSFGKAIGGAVLTVSEARNRRKIAETTTDPNGRFEVLSLRPGFYAVDIKLSGVPPVLGTGTIPLLVVVHDVTTVGRIELAVTFTSCGWQYEARPLEE